MGDTGLRENSIQIKCIIDFLEQHCSGLESLHNDLGHRLLGHGLKKRGGRAGITYTTKHTESVTRELVSRELEFEPPAPAPVQRKSRVPERKKLPHLTPPEEAELDEILKHKNVSIHIDGKEVVHYHDHEHGHDINIKMKNPMDFAKVKHGESTVATLLHEDREMVMITDVAKVLQVSRTATLMVEGHTATPPNKMDAWAHELALNRAEKIKSLIVSQGVDASRIETKAGLEILVMVTMM